MINSYIAIFMIGAGYGIAFSFCLEATRGAKGSFIEKILFSLTWPIWFPILFPYFAIKQYLEKEVKSGSKN